MHGAPSPPPSITPAEEDKRLALQLIIAHAVFFDIKFQIFRVTYFLFKTVKVP